MKSGIELTIRKAVNDGFHRYARCLTFEIRPSYIKIYVISSM